MPGALCAATSASKDACTRAAGSWVSTTDGRTDAREMVPAVPDGVVFHDELGRHGRAIAQRERRGPVELRIREGAHGGGRLAAIVAQQVERSGLRDTCLVLGMLGIH